MVLRDRAAIEQILQRLRLDPPATEEHLTRIYRRLLRTTHPDSAGGSSELFLFVQERFQLYRAEWIDLRHRRGLVAGADPWVVVRELGLPETLTPRQALYAGLYRFRALGLASWRVRSRPALRARNARVVQSIIYWAYESDGAFVTVFEDFLRYQGRFGIGEKEAPLFFMIRRMVLRTLDWLIRYQSSGRPAARDIGRDAIGYARMLATAHRSHRSFAALLGLLDWIGDEFDREPAMVGLDL